MSLFLEGLLKSQHAHLIKPCPDVLQDTGSPAAYCVRKRYLGEDWDGMEPLAEELASRSSIGEVQTGLLEANSSAYCRTSTKGNLLGPEP